MPLYEYRCRDCATTFELLRPASDRELVAVCPRCESRTTMPLISLVAASRAGSAERLSAGDGGGCCGGSCGCRAG